MPPADPPPNPPTPSLPARLAYIAGIALIVFVTLAGTGLALMWGYGHLMPAPPPGPSPAVVDAAALGKAWPARLGRADAKGRLAADAALGAGKTFDDAQKAHQDAFRAAMEAEWLANVWPAAQAAFPPPGQHDPAKVESARKFLRDFAAAEAR